MDSFIFKTTKTDPLQMSLGTEEEPMAIVERDLFQIEPVGPGHAVDSYLKIGDIQGESLDAVGGKGFATFEDPLFG